MSNKELLNWCIEKGFNSPNHLAALLSTFTPDLEELNSWEIIENSYMEFTINDIFYNIMTEEEVMKEISLYKQYVQDDYLEEVPENLQEFIDWESYWKENPITIDMYIEGNTKIVFDNITYYCLETTNSTL